MTAKILDGKALALRVREGLRADVAMVVGKRGRPPGLAVVLVGDDPASAVYVRNKEAAAGSIEMFSEVIRRPASLTQAELIAIVEALNARADIDGYLVQLPLPKGLDVVATTNAIDPDKDADGLHPVNLGRVMTGEPGPRPCTAAGVLALIDEAGLDLQGKHAVVIGRSTIVGKPTALMCLERNATVTLCHSKTPDLAAEVRRADLVVAAVGKPGLVRADWLKPGAVVIDVGTTRADDGKLRGDVDYAGASAVASAITPVPGGVGPMTIAMLLRNAVRAAVRNVS
ncbi:MAG: bifunctional methylenetetrahydrofolate dehydrogenase/methenyltetrahydrofolate cyclohydrolase FolD [Clostridia bacterium]|nr:bifunctional methylenetetrahydrofolate dehydrogenase/methenyltetrahydrofolate cyclohydrolase FolD [Deltaproteobacteria bacterium]